MWHGIAESTRSGDVIATSADANGNAQGFLGPCPEGYCWYVERNSCWSNTAQTAPLLELFVLPTNLRPANANDKGGRQDVATGSVVQEGQSDQASPIFVGPGYFLVAAWSSLASGDLVALSVQIRVHKLPRADRRSHGRPAEHHGLL